jgi:hypothetical protein
VIGAVGRHLLGTDGHAGAAHLVHYLLLGIAVIVFLAFVAVDVRRHGWPRFSWRGPRGLIAERGRSGRIGRAVRPGR